MDVCSGCGADNRDGARYCASCGASLARPCPACGAIPPSAAARFCDACGSALGARPAAPAATPRAAQARKMVTVLFADLSGSTAAADGVDPESVRRTMDRYYAAMRTEIERHGGRLVKVIGDGVMAAFGVPDVREDDARRALEAAVAMQGAYADLVDDGHAGLRIGINTGEVVVTADDDDVVGDAVNVAARLEQAAAAGEIVVGEATFRLVRLTAQLRALPPLTVRGKPEPVQAFRLLSLHPIAETRGAAPFIGRAAEINRLLTVLDDAIKSSGARLASIVGSPGVGKTRLARELAVAASDRARVVEVRCDPAGAATFAPIADALRLAASLDDDAGEETIVAALTALLPEDEPNRDRVATVAAAVLGAGEPSQPEETFWAVRRLVENGARLRPIVLVFDDVHWAEPLLLDLIDNLAEWIRDAAVLLVMTARPELREVRPSLVEESGRMSAVIHLEGLGIDESRRLALELLDTDWLPEPLLDRLATASEGNPLFVGELVRMLVDDGVLIKDGDEWTATVDLDEIDVPLTIHALLSARIDRLGAGEQAVLEAASIVGKTFYRGAVADLVGGRVRGELDDILERLRRKELVEPAGTYWIDEPVFRFHHVLIRDAAYRRLLKDARSDLHAKVAGWFEAKVGDLTDHDDVIGYQLEQAYRLRAEIDTPDRAIGQRAAARLAAAGLRALESDDCASAGALIGRALECLHTDDPTVPDLLVARCEALLSAGDVVRALPAVDRLTAVPDRSDRLEAWAACFAAELANLTSTGSLEQSAANAAAAAERLVALGDVAGEAKAHAVRAASLARLGRIGECEATLDRALGAARRAGDRRRATAVLAGAPVAALWGPNPVTRASGRCLDVVRVLRITSRAPAVEATSLRCQAVLEALRGRFDAGRRMLASARASLEDLGNAPGLLELDLAAGMVETLAGELVIAEEHLRRARDGFLDLGIDADAALASALLADALVARGRVGEAIPFTEESERLGGGDLRTAIAWRAVRSDALVSQGNPEAALQLARAAVSLAESTDALVDHAKALASLARALRAAGDEDGARARAQRALELYERKEASVLADQVRTFLGNAPARDLPAVGPDSAPTSVAPPSNRATRLAEAVLDAALKDGWESTRSSYADDVTFRDHRPVVREEIMGLDAFLSNAQTIVSLGVNATVLEHLLLRGDALALSRIAWRGDGAEVLNLLLYELDDDGLFTAVDSYDIDQLAEATEEIERRYIVGEAAAYAGSWVSSAEWLLALNARDFDRLRANLHESFSAEDHRTLGWGKVDADQFAELYVNAFDLAPDIWFALVEVLALTENGVCARAEGRGVTMPGAEFNTFATAVLRTIGGKLSRIDFFEIDEPERGLALLEGSEVRLENAAVRTVRRICELLVGERWDEFAGLHHAQAEYHDRRRLIGGVSAFGRQDVVALARSAVDIGVREIDVQVEAIRGDHLALVREVMRGPGGDAELLVIAEVDDEVHQLVLLDPEQIDEAYALLDERYLAAMLDGHTAVWRAVARVPHAVAAGSAALRDCVTDDFEVVDHRPASMGTLGVDDWLDLFPPLFEVSSDVRYRMVADLEVSSRGLLGRYEVVGTRDGGAFATTYLAVFEVRTERLARVDVYPLDEVDLARTRFAELAGSTSLLENAATRAKLAETALGLAGDWERLAAYYAEDTVVCDRRPIVGGLTIAGRDPMVEVTRGVIAIGVTTVDQHFIAIRGARLCLARVRYAGKAGEDSVLMLTELDDHGEIARTDIFDVDDLDTAFALLDERFLEGEGASHADAWRVVRAVIGRGLDAHDLDAVRAATSADVVLDDHRPVGWGRVTKDEWLGLYPPLFEQSPDVRWPMLRDLGASAQAAYGEFELRGTREGGEIRSPLIGVFSVADGLCTRIDIYAPEDRALADACFAELSGAELTASGALENAATRVYDRSSRAHSADDLEAALSTIFSDDVVMCDRRPLVGGGLETVGLAAGVAAVRGIRDVGASPAQWEHIAVRGQRLALTRLVMAGDAGEVEVLQVTRLDGDGLVDRFDTFELDQLGEALACLEDRFIELEATADRGWGPIACLMRAIDGRDLAAASEWVDDRLVVVDHRPLGWGTLDREGFLGLFEPMYEQSPDARWLVVRDVRRAGDVVCMRIEITGTAAEGGAFSISVAPVVVSRGGRVHRLENFDAERLDDALARFEELAARSDLVGNLATARTEDIVSRSLSGQWDDIAEVATEDASMVDNRPLVGGLEHVGHDELIAMNVAMRSLGPAADVRHIATRGSRLGLSRVVFSGLGTEVETMWVTEAAPDGRARRTTMFDPSQIDDAFALLDERYLAGEGDASLGWKRFVDGFDALNHRSIDALAAIVADDLVVVDHRPLGWGTLDTEGLLGLYPPMFERSDDVRWRLIDTLAVSRDVVCAQVHIAGAERQGGAFTIELLAVFVTDTNGQMSRMDTFGLDDRNAALACYDELVALRRVGRARNELGRRVLTRDLDAMVAVTAPDVVMNDRRPVVGFSTVGDSEDARRTWEAFLSLNVTAMREERVAVRGDRLELCNMAYGHAGALVDALQLFEIDRQGLLCAIETFEAEQLDEALALLEERFLAGEAEGSAAWRAVVRSIAAANARDWDEFRASLHADFEVVDHRALGWGTLDREGYLAMYPPIVERSPDVRFLIVRDVAVSPGVVCMVVAVDGTTAEGGGSFAIPRVGVMTGDADGFRRMEMYEPESLDEAMTRYRALSSAPD